MDSPRRRVLCALVVSAALVLPSQVALAKGPGGGGGGGGGGETALANNLSVPTIMVGGGGFTGIACEGTLVPPSGVPLTAYPIDPSAYYYVQGVHKWQAQCSSTTSVGPVTAKWGDNLTGDAKLKVGSPIRVELGLFASGIPMSGYSVLKLEPLKLDRESKYGTLATADGSGEFHATATTFDPVRVFDGKATFSIKQVGGDYVVPLGTTAKAEINAVGAVVYGYNLRVTAAGQYEITYTTPSVDVGTTDNHTVTLVITVVTGGRK